MPEDPREGDFIDPIDIPDVDVYTGVFTAEPRSELRRALGVTSIRQFLNNYIARNLIYVNVHSFGTVPISRGFPNA